MLMWQVEMSIALDTAASCYARSKGEQIALNVDGGETEEDAVFKRWDIDYWCAVNKEKP